MISAERRIAFLLAAGMLAASALPAAAAVFGERLFIDYSSGKVFGSEYRNTLSFLETLLSLLSASLAFIFILMKLRIRTDSFLIQGKRMSPAAAFLPWIPLLVHNAFFSASAFTGLYVGDYDFTNISSALNRTVFRNGILTTPFVPTGDSGSFLGHHFSPSLLLYTPFYYIMHTADASGILPSQFSGHQIYAVLLWLTLAFSAVQWTRLSLAVSKNTAAAFFISAVLSTAFPVWRLAGSFHFEILVLPFSALAMLSLMRKQRRYWLYLILWIGVKEDVSVYTAFFGLYLMSKGRMKTGFITGLISAVYFAAAAGPVHDWLTGGNGADFFTYFTRASEETKFFSSFFGILLSFGLLPLLSIRLFFLAVLPVTLIHFNSEHAWHNTFYGHYVYSLLPFLMYAAAEKIRDYSGTGFFSFGYVKPAFFWLVLSAVFLANSREKENPPLLFRTDERFVTLQKIIPIIVKNSCIRTQIPFTAHMPLHADVFPMLPPGKNPLAFSDEACSVRYILIQTEDERIPYYTKKALLNIDRSAAESMELIYNEKGMKLYRSM